MDLHEIIPSAIVAVGSVLLSAAPFSRKYRRAPRWIRSGFFLAAPLAFVWSALGLYLALHETSHQTHLNWPRFWFLYSTQATVGGMALGILISLVISPEFYRRYDRNASV